MIQPPIDKILEVMNSKGYRVYNTPTVDWNLNIIGIRNRSLVPERFDDTLVVFHNFLDNWLVSYYPITTDPSVFYLRNPMVDVAAKGTAILKEGQYQGAYMIDKHRNNYYALCQRLQPVKVFRDNDRDGTLRLNPATVEEGMFAINIHKGPLNGDWNSENSIYSAGCQVFADSRHFNEFMMKCRNGERQFGNKFTYTLLNESDFD